MGVSQTVHSTSYLHLLAISLVPIGSKLKWNFAQKNGYTMRLAADSLYKRRKTVYVYRARTTMNIIHNLDYYGDSRIIIPLKHQHSFIPFTN